MLLPFTQKAALAAARQRGDFGPDTWYALHALALNVVGTRGAARAARFLRTRFASALSCPVCRVHLREMLAYCPPEDFVGFGRAGIVALLYVYHSLVNLNLGKKNVSFLSFERKILGDHLAKKEAAAAARKLREEVARHDLRRIIRSYLR